MLTQPPPCRLIIEYADQYSPVAELGGYVSSITNGTLSPVAFPLGGGNLTTCHIYFLKLQISSSPYFPPILFFLFRWHPACPQVDIFSLLYHSINGA